MPQSASMTSELRQTIADFLVGLENDATDPHLLEDILYNDYVPTSEDLGYKPETYAENNLIDELLNDLNLEYEQQPYAEAGSHGNWPDFELTDLDIEPDVIGENKPFNNSTEAIPDIKDYLDKKSVGAEYGIATDGFDWYLYKIEVGGDSTNYPEVRHIDLKPALRQIARDRNLVGQTSVGETDDVEDVLQAFVDVFRKDEFESLLSQRAPRELRDARKRDVEEFYELYIELLFGEGDEHSYETNLMNDIKPPKGADESDQRLFVVTLMNRLLFVKFLESRDVMEDGFLRDIANRHEEGEGWASLYRTYIQPLFYDLLNTPKNRRDEKYQGEEPFESVPYLNGGLFRTNVDREKEYDVADRILPIVIDDLIEGSELELRNGKLDPAVLGSVFEKTINHMGGGKTQKDIGAYYTPNDVTELVSEQTVDPKIEETLVEVFVDEFAGGDTEEGVRETLDDLGLSGILRKVENGNDVAFRTDDGVVNIEFSDNDAIERAKEEIEDLKVLDPACGSGHFLTTAMDEIHRVQLSLMRGIADEDEVPSEKRYEAKQRLALDSTYGVDVDGVATEIAKLRIWLKIVEENGWNEDFGRLPNIDVNIMSGNSLVGFPIVGEHYPGDIWDGDVEDLVELRKEYKEGGDVSKDEIEDLLEEDIRPRVDEKFVDNLTYTVETEIESVEEFQEVVEAIPEETFYPYVEKVQVQNADGSSLSDEQQEYLEEKGFRTYSKSANIDVEDWQSELESSDRPDWRTHYHVMIEELEELLEEGYVFSEFVRQPLSYDLENIYGDPFHWVVEFAEVAEVEGATHSVDFDLIVGNPPYGDILGDEAEMFTENYKTGGINEVSAQFVERQLQLLEEGGYFGNVTTLRLIYQSSLDNLHNLIRDKLSLTQVACFGFRPSRVFEGAHVRVAIITGRRDTNENVSSIYTSDLILFNEDNRDEVMSNIQYGDTSGLVLGDRIGGSEGSPILPKVGQETKRRILVNLREYSDITLGDLFYREETDGTSYRLYKRRGVLYWINPMLEKLYEGSEVEPVWFESKLERDAAFLIMNSSLYFLYWQTYSNQHHHNWSHMRPFPFPKEEKLENSADEIESLSSELWGHMKDSFSQSREGRGDFSMGALRPIIDDVDRLMGELYNLSDDQVRYTQNYLTDLGENSGREGREDHNLIYESIFGD